MSFGENPAFYAFVNQCFLNLGDPIFTKLTLAPAQIKSLHATPVQILPAPGAGLVIIPEEVIYRLIFNSIAYTALAGANAALYYGSVVANNGLFSFGDTIGGSLLVQAADRMSSYSGPPFSVNFLTSQFINQALFAGNENANEWTAGDSNFQIDLVYRIAKIS